MIVVHHLNNSRSQRVLWLLEELGLEYEIKRYERDPVTLLAPPALRAVHPLGKAPVLTDGALTLAESGAIIEYLVEREAPAGLAPPRGTPERLRYTYWMHFAEGSAMPPLLLKLIFDRIRKAPLPWALRPVVGPIARHIADQVLKGFVVPNLQRNLEFIEAELGAAPWFAGDRFSAADIQMSFPMQASRGRAGLDRRYPRAGDWLARIEARPAYQRALARGGTYDM